MSAGEYCNRSVVVISREASIQEAAELMRKHHVGDLVVVEERADRNRPVGLVTDRDIVVELIAKGVDLDSVIVGDIMSFELLAAGEDDDLLFTIKRMRAKGVRRIPVLDRGGALIGILALDDVIDLLAEMLVDVARIIVREQKREQETRH